MTKEQLDRIEKAYSSGLKVQIWFNGYWEDFDIRDYSMYSEPFSENRQYRIIGSDYADIAEKQIADLENKIADIKANCDLAIEGRDVKIKELVQQIEKMKCCSNCKHFNKEEDVEYCWNCERQLVNSLDNLKAEEIIKDEWEIEK